MKKLSPFRHFKTSPEVNRLAVMVYVRYWLSFRQVEDLLFERAIDMCRETVRWWWNRFGLGTDDVGVAALLEVRIEDRYENRGHARLPFQRGGR
jgi:hypothetical protein